MDEEIKDAEFTEDSDDEYVELDEIDSNRRTSKVKSGLSAVGSFLKKGLQDTGHNIKEVGGYVKTGVVKAHGYLKEKGEKYKAEEPQRRQRKLEKEQYKTQMMQERMKQSKLQYKTSKFKNKSRPVPRFGSGFGGISLMGGGFGSMGNSKSNNQPIQQARPMIDPFKIDPWRIQPGMAMKPSYTEPKTKKSKSKNFVVVNGKKYFRR